MPPRVRTGGLREMQKDKCETSAVWKYAVITRLGYIFYIVDRLACSLEWTRDVASLDVACIISVRARARCSYLREIESWISGVHVEPYPLPVL